MSVLALSSDDEQNFKRVCRQTALSTASHISVRSNNAIGHTPEDILVEAEKIYQWLIKDLSPISEVKNVNMGTKSIVDRL